MEEQELTKEQIYTDFKHAVNAIAESLQVGAEHVYEILVRQQLIESVGICLLLAFIAMISGVSFKKLELVGKEDEQYDGARWIPFCIGLFAFIIVFAIAGESILTGFFNPEYGAIQEIQDIIK